MRRYVQTGYGAIRDHVALVEAPMPVAVPARLLIDLVN